MASSYRKPTLSVLFWNANGLQDKIPELRDFLEDSQVDVVLVQETMFRPTCRNNICNYSLHRLDRPPVIPRTRISGGVAIYVRRGINHYPIRDLVTDSLESASVMIMLNDRQKLLITSAYVRHNRDFPIPDFSKIFSHNASCIVAGDFNAHNRAWRCRGTNRNGRELLKFVTDNTDIKLIPPPSPTRFGRGFPSFIDMALVQNFNYHSEIEVLNLFDSDHLPVLLTFDLSINIQISPTQKFINWPKYQENLVNSDLLYPSIRSTEDIERATKTLTDCINLAAENASHTLPKPKIHDLPREIKTMIKDRNVARKRYQITRNPADRANYYRLKAITRREIHQHRDRTWSGFIQNLNAEDNSLWRMQKLLRRNPNTNSFPPLTGQNGVAFDDSGKAELLANVYYDQFSINSDLGDPTLEGQVDSEVSAFFAVPPTTPLAECTIAEIKLIISKFKDRKTPGYDCISNRAIKNMTDNIIIYFTAIINAILKFHYFPDIWKISIISPIPKPGSDRTLPVNYRPISLLSSLSKVAERVMQKRILDYLDTHNLLIPEQFGFRPGHSTTGQILRIVELASQGLQDRRPTGAILLDLAKAFDRIPHRELMYKLIKLGIPDTMIYLLYSYLSQRFFKVRVNNTHSTLRIIRAGVLQGSCLGPVFFLMYINDCPRTINTHLALFADDTGIVATAWHFHVLARFLQTHIDILEEYFNRWKLRLNPSKCQAIHFSCKRGDPPRLYVNNMAINWENTAVYLGVKIDRRLTWSPHITDVVKKMNCKFESLKTLFNSKHLSFHNKTLLYKATVLPIALYACPTWSHAANTNIQRIERTQNKSLRRIRRAWRYLKNSVIRRDLNCKTFKQQAQEISIKFYNKLRALPNEIVAGLPDYDFSDPTNFRRPRATMLDPG